MNARRYIHANALVVGDAGVLLRGPSRSGKSTLTMRIVALAQTQGRFARLVGDDRVSVEVSDGRIIARPHPTIAGLIEARGQGIIAMPYEPACVLRLVVDLLSRDANVPLDPSDAARTAQIASVEVPRIVENAFQGDAAARILSCIQHSMTK